MKTRLNDMQQMTCEFIEKYTDEHGRPPSYRDIARGLECSVPYVQKIVYVLESAGYITRIPGKAGHRTLAVTAKWHLECQIDTSGNPMVPVVLEERPELFEGWTGEECQRLVAIRNMGGAMSREQAVLEAERIINDRARVTQFANLLATSKRDQALAFLEAMESKDVSPGKAQPRRLKSGEKQNGHVRRSAARH